MYQHKVRNKSFQPEIPISGIKEVIKEARSVSFPWDSISPAIKTWLEAMAGSVNTQPEFLLLAALSATSCLMGPDCVFHVRDRHQEPCNIFTICLCEPGTGKTQAYKIAIEDPLDGLPIEILVHDYTSKGLFEHLKSREGRALVCHAEMTSFFENLLKKQSEGGGERQMFCRFHDGNSKIIRTSHGKGGKKEEVKDEREQLDKACLVIGGFSQPQPYINLHQLLDVYKKIYEAHSNQPTKYEFSVPAKEIYETFSDEIVEEMNRQLAEDIVIQNNMSKDRKIFIRLCGVIHVLFYTLHYFLDDRDTIESEEFGIPEQVSHETAQTVLELVRYFSKQRAILNKGKVKQGLSAEKDDNINVNDENVFAQIGNTLCDACNGKKPEEIAAFVRSTTLGHVPAVAIRWNEIPGKVPLTKSELFAHLSCHRDLCTLSCTRDMMQKDGKSKNVRCVAVKIAAFSKKMQRSLFEVIPDLTWQPEENDMTDECEEISKMAMNVDDENQPPQLKDEEIHLITKSDDKGTSSNEQQNKLPEKQPLQLKDQEMPPITKSGDKGTSSNDQQNELPVDKPLQLKDQEIHVVTKSGGKGTSSIDQQKELPLNKPLQLNDQEIPPIGKSGDKATSSNNQKKRKTPFDSLKDSLSANEKVDGKRQRKPRSIDD